MKMFRCCPILSVDDQALSKKISLGRESQKINSGCNRRHPKRVYSRAWNRGFSSDYLTQTAEDLHVRRPVDPNVKCFISYYRIRVNGNVGMFGKGFSFIVSQDVNSTKRVSNHD